MPHQTKDPVVAAGMVIVALQTLVSRQLSPFDHAVISLTKLHAGSAFNVIPGVATVGGTRRTMLPETRDEFLQQIESVARTAAGVTGCEVSMEIRQATRRQSIMRMTHCLPAVLSPNCLARRASRLT